MQPKNPLLFFVLLILISSCGGQSSDVSVGQWAGLLEDMGTEAANIDTGGCVQQAKEILLGYMDSVIEAYQTAGDGEVTEAKFRLNEANSEYVAFLAFIGSEAIAKFSTGDDGLTQELSLGELVRFIGHTGVVRWAAWSSDSSRVASVSDDGTARIWDARTGEELNIIVHDFSVPDEVGWSEDKVLLAIRSGSEHIVKIWRIIDGEQVSEFEGQDGFEWAPTGTSIATFINQQIPDEIDEGLFVWDAYSSNNVMRSGQYWRTKIQDISWSPERNAIATALNQTEIFFFSSTGRGVIGRVASMDAVGRNSTLSIAFSPDGSRLASRHQRNQDGQEIVLIWETENFTPLASIDVTELLQSMAWSADSSMLAIANDRGFVVYAADDGSELLTFNGHQDVVSSVDWSPNGNWIVTSSLDGTARVWDIEMLLSSP